MDKIVFYKKYEFSKNDLLDKPITLDLLDNLSKNLEGEWLTGKAVIDSWKGKSGVEVSKDFLTGDFILVEHMKDKKTGEVKEVEHSVKSENIKYLSDVLIKIGAMSHKVYSRNIWKYIIEDKNLNISVDSFNGGSNRSKYYFPLYYYPAKVLEAKDVISFDRGGILFI